MQGTPPSGCRCRSRSNSACVPNSVCEREQVEAPNVSAHRGHKTLVAFAASGTCSRYTPPSLITHFKCGFKNSRGRGGISLFTTVKTLPTQPNMNDKWYCNRPSINIRECTLCASMPLHHQKELGRVARSFGIQKGILPDQPPRCPPSV